MTKKLFLCLTALVLLVMYSCGSDDSTSGGGISSLEVGTFKLNVDGEDVKFINGTIARSENDFALNTFDPNGGLDGFSMSFHRKGNFGQVVYLANSGENGFPDSYTSAYTYAGSSFKFNIIDINNESVSATFSGTLFMNELDIESSSVEVSGEFNLPITNIEPFTPGLEVSAKINNKEWYSTTTSKTITNSRELSTNFSNETKYEIHLVTEIGNAREGNFTFDENSEYNKVRFLVYESSDSEPIEFKTKGTFSINSIENAFFNSFIEADFSFTAEHPTTEEVIEVNSIKAKYLFSE